MLPRVHPLAQDAVGRPNTRMSIRTIADARDELQEILASRDCALIVGAGASVSSGGPVSATPVDQLRSRFSLAAIPAGASLLDAGTTICNPPPYGRLQLVQM